MNISCVCPGITSAQQRFYLVNPHLTYYILDENFLVLGEEGVRQSISREYHCDVIIIQ